MFFRVIFWLSCRCNTGDNCNTRIMRGMWLSSLSSAGSVGGGSCTFGCSTSGDSGVGSTASTQKGPLMRVVLLSVSGLSTSTSLGGRLVVGDGFQRDVGDDAADFLAFFVLFAGIDETAAGAALRVFECVVGIGGGEQALAGQGQRYAGDIGGNPAAPPLLGDHGGGAAAAGWVPVPDRRGRWSLGCSVG